MNLRQSIANAFIERVMAVALLTGVMDRAGSPPLRAMPKHARAALHAQVQA